MALKETEVVEIGARFVADRLVQQAGTLVKQAQDDGLKFPEGFLPGVEARVAEIKALRADQTTAKSDVPLGTSGQAEAFGAVKEWITDALEACDNAYEEDPDMRDRFHKTNGKIGRSVTRLLDRAEELVPLLKPADVAAAIAQWDFDAAKIAEGETLIAQLRDADKEQELALKNLPAKTYALYLAKGKLYLDLKRIARRGRTRFKDNPAKAGAYTLNLLRRSGRTTKTTTKTETT